MLRLEHQQIQGNLFSKPPEPGSNSVAFSSTNPRETSSDDMDRSDKILIVDDESIGRDTLNALLYGRGYELCFAADGAEALERVEELPPDLILLDVMMPQMDGFQVCRYLKADERWKHIPIILVTALDGKEDLAQGFDAGADDFISKPVNSVELRARVRSLLRLKKQFDELQAMLKLREDLANMIVHDMRTPLTTILGISELLKQGNITSNDQSELDTLHRQAMRLHAFVNDLLTMAKMEAGKLNLNRSLVNVNELVSEVEKGYKISAQLKDVQFTVQLPQQAYRTLLDVSLFQRLLDNLLSNAIKFTGSGGKVILKLEYLKRDQPFMGIRLEVVDEGVGIDLESKQKLFGRFETATVGQPHLALQPFSQMGLGLTFCKMVVEAHGGHIEVEPNQPHGSRFIVEL